LFLRTSLNLSSNRHGFYHIVLKVGNKALSRLKPTPVSANTSTERHYLRIIRGSRTRITEKTLSFHHCQPALGVGWLA